MASKVNWSDLVGKYFATVKDGKLDMQGAVLGNVGEGYYTISYWDQETGDASEVEIIHISKLADGYFFTNFNERVAFTFEEILHWIEPKEEASINID